MLALARQEMFEMQRAENLSRLPAEPTHPVTVALGHVPQQLLFPLRLQHCMEIRTTPDPQDCERPEKLFVGNFV